MAAIGSIPHSTARRTQLPIVPSAVRSSAPKQAAVMIMTAQIGFTVGMAKKAALEATAMAHIDAKATSSRAEGLRRSNEIKNGTHAAIIITNAEM